jgi:ParB/RepB/Spo0J family partition protein
VSPEQQTDVDEQPSSAAEPEAERFADALDLPGAEPSPMDYRDIPLTDIAEVSNIRARSEYYGIDKLAETMHLQSQLQPVTVRPALDPSHGKPFELVFGYRRKRAAEYLHQQGKQGWDTLRCHVDEVPDDRKRLQMVIENHHREAPSAVAEARTMRELITFGGMNQAEVARALGCSPSHVSHRLDLLKLALPDRSENENSPTVGSGAAGDPVVEQKATPAQLGPVDDDDHVDILGLIEDGKLSASAAEVIAGIDDRGSQEKVAALATRYDWSVKKVEQYSRKLAAHDPDLGGAEMGPVDMVVPEDAVDLPRLTLRSDLVDDDYDRIDVFALLRNGMDQEMLEYLQERMGYPYEYLWSYVAALTEPQLKSLRELLLRRYISAAHRYHDFEPELHDRFALPPEAPATAQKQAAEQAKLALPDAFSAELPAAGERG